MPANPAGGHGHVEGVPQLDAQGWPRATARIVFDKFHVLRHLGEAIDKVRKLEYGRLAGPGRRFIKGQKYTLLSRWENLTEKGREALELLFNANRRLNRAYLLKEQFGQLWDFDTPRQHVTSYSSGSMAQRTMMSAACASTRNLAWASGPNPESVSFCPARLQTTRPSGIFMGSGSRTARS